MKKFIVLSLILGVLTLGVFAETFSFIKIEGNKHISTSFIMSKLSDVKLGVPVNREALYRDLQNLYDTGVFSYIEPKVEPSPLGLGLVIQVTENPLVKNVKVVVDGPELVKKSKIKEAVKVKKDEVLNLNALKETFQSVLKLYTDKGYLPNVVGISTNIVRHQNSLSLPNSELVLTVKEYAIWTLELKGNYGKLTPKEIINRTGLFTLKDFEKLNPLLKFLVDYKKAYPKVSDIQAFQSKLAEMGYFSPETSLGFVPTKVSTSVFKYPVMNIVVNSSLKKVIKSGLPYQQYFISGVSEVNPFALAKYAGISAPSTTDNFVQLSQLEKIRSYYKSKGYLLTGASLNYYKYHFIGGEVLEYKVLQRYVGKIKVIGNKKTKDYLVKREIQLKTGEPLTAQALLQTYNNLKNTGFFSDVSIYPQMTTENSSHVNVIVKLIENNKPRTFKAMLTFKEPKDGEPWYTGIIATGKLGISNWAGYGQSLNAELNIGQEPNANLSYGVIFPFNLPMNFNTSVYYKTLKPFKSVNGKNIYYHETRKGFSMSVGYQPNVHTSFDVGGHFEWFTRSEDSTPVDFGPASGTSRELNFTFNYVNVDDIFMPMRGIKLSLSARTAGFGGTENYQSYSAMAAAYVPLFDRLSLAGRVLIGTASGKDFQVGGPMTVRGWKPRSGDQELVTNLSLRYAVPSNIPITLNAFYDWGGAKDQILTKGNLDTDFMNTLGVGFSVKIPFVGVVRIDFPFQVQNGVFKYGGTSFGIGEMF